MLNIITIPDPKLRQRSTPVPSTQITQTDFQDFIDELIGMMKTADGIGIAAVQVARLIRVFVVDTQDGPEVFINPKILWRSFGSEVGEEGCLSIPGVYGLVKRPKSLILIYTDRTGKSRRLRAKGLLARVICHENDHINGLLFTDKMIKQTAGQDSHGNA